MTIKPLAFGMNYRQSISKLTFVSSTEYSTERNRKSYFIAA